MCESLRFLINDRADELTFCTRYLFGDLQSHTDVWRKVEWSRDYLEIFANGSQQRAKLRAIILSDFPTREKAIAYALATPKRNTEPPKRIIDDKTHLH